MSNIKRFVSSKVLIIIGICCWTLFFLGRFLGHGKILLSHSPQEIENAANAGVNLMLSGHTHGGQIWPFNYLIMIRYPYIKGEYDINGMTLIVSRGTGLWGPRMRLWQRGEISHITLHKKIS